MIKISHTIVDTNTMLVWTYHVFYAMTKISQKLIGFNTTLAWSNTLVTNIVLYDYNCWST
jgi:hypothetical protein